MDPQSQFCSSAQCRDRWPRGQGTIGIHSQKEQRYVCATCGRTFAATTGTVHYRLRTEAVVVTQVLTLLCHGCPPQAIVAAFGLDERTVAAWQQRAGTHCQRVHEHLVQAGQVDEAPALDIEDETTCSSDSQRRRSTAVRSRVAPASLAPFRPGAVSRALPRSLAPPVMRWSSTSLLVRAPARGDWRTPRR